mmetsp:Transcript_47228/g.81209  ORF Transcript_47228/g.81209 Transcript_47228/m.81209 type:complete len:87 (+) Transcript_47228:213-473(+)
MLKKTKTLLHGKFCRLYHHSCYQAQPTLNSLMLYHSVHFVQKKLGKQIQDEQQEENAELYADAAKKNIIKRSSHAAKLRSGPMLQN